MRILVLGINYWPEETGIAVFNTGRCEELAARGHEVTMCTAFPYYPEWKVPPAYRGRLAAREQRNGVTILRSRIYVPERPSPVRRILHEASFIASSCLRALTGARPDLLFVVSPPLGLAVSAVMLSRRWRIPYVFHVTDLQPDTAFDLEMLPVGLLAKLLYRIERLAYDRASVVSTLTEGMRAKILAKGITANKVRLFSDWADPRLFDIPIGGDGGDVRRQFGLEGQFLIVHAGNMGVKQGLDVVLGAAERLRAVGDMTFLLVGDGAVRAELQASAEARGLSNVKFLPLQERPVFHDLLAAADICLVTQQRVVAEVVFPSKVVTLLAAGRPIVASVNPSSEVARVLIEAGGGVVVEAEEPSALADAVLSLRLEGDRRREMSARGRAYARRRWDKAAIIDDAERWLSDLVGPSPALRPAASR